MQRPQSNEYFDYYGNYVRLVPDGDLFEIGKSQPGELRACLEFCTESQSEELHPPYTWTVKQVIGHLIDTERIFADRFHRFSCNDLQALPGFDQNEYVDNCNYQLPKLSDLLDEFEHILIGDVVHQAAEEMFVIDRGETIGDIERNGPEQFR